MLTLTSFLWNIRSRQRLDWDCLEEVGEVGRPGLGDVTQGHPSAPLCAGGAGEGWQQVPLNKSMDAFQTSLGTTLHHLCVRTAEGAEQGQPLGRQLVVLLWGSRDTCSGGSSVPRCSSWLVGNALAF